MECLGTSSQIKKHQSLGESTSPNVNVISNLILLTLNPRNKKTVLISYTNTEHPNRMKENVVVHGISDQLIY